MALYRAKVNHLSPGRRMLRTDPGRSCGDSNRPDARLMIHYEVASGRQQSNRVRWPPSATPCCPSWFPASCASPAPNVLCKERS